MTQSVGVAKIKRYLRSRGLDFSTEKRFQTCRCQRPLPFDFHIKRTKILIEYDGQQHFKPVPQYGGEKALRALQKRDAIKTLWCVRNGYYLIRIKYSDVKNVYKILDYHLFSVRGLCRKQESKKKPKTKRKNSSPKKKTRKNKKKSNRVRSNPRSRGA